MIWKAALLWRGVLLCCLALAPAQGCFDDLCRSEEPSFQVDVIPGAGVKVSTLAELVVTVRAGSFQKKEVRFPLAGKMDDGRTSFVVVLGAAGAGGFSAEVLVQARDARGTVRAWARRTYTGEGNACNFFEMSLTTGDLGEQDLDGDGEKGAADCDDNDPCRSHLL